ncbi:MAG TPA: hypothetical protein PLV32_09620 [Chitinophagaceae bacterium]|nr:hypothetical protein [Chitinophagaceae bacterium]
MRKCILLVSAICFTFASFASLTPKNPPLKASEVFIPIGTTGERISLLDLSQLKIREYQELTGKKMKLMDKIAFKAAQRQLKNSINYDGTFNSKKIEAGGFFLGCLLGLIGVLIAYLINDDQKRNRVKWAWLGLAAWIVILIIALVV